MKPPRESDVRTLHVPSAVHRVWARALLKELGYVVLRSRRLPRNSWLVRYRRR